MRNLSQITLLFTMLFVMFFFNSFGQHYSTLKKVSNTKLYQWQTHNSNGTFTFGISKNKKHADSIVSNFKYRNRNTKYKPYYSTIEPVDGKDIQFYKDFINNFPKQYVVLNDDEILALSLCRKKGVKDAAYFLKSINSCNNLKFCIGKIWDLNDKTKQLSFL